MTTTKPEYIKKADLALRLGVSQKTVDRWRKRKILNVAPVRVAGLTLFRVEEVDACLTELAAKAVTEAGVAQQ